MQRAEVRFRVDYDPALLPFRSVAQAWIGGASLSKDAGDIVSLEQTLVAYASCEERVGEVRETVSLNGRVTGSPLLPAEAGIVFSCLAPSTQPSSETESVNDASSSGQDAGGCVVGNQHTKRPWLSMGALLGLAFASHVRGQRKARKRLGRAATGASTGRVSR
jgi:hypothetical protein